MRLRAALLAVCLAGPVLAQDPGPTTDQAIRDVLGGDPAEYRRVVEGFQAALRDGDAKGAAAFVSYPIDLTIAGKPVSIPDAAAFVADYARIVPPALAAAVDRQPFDDLFVRDQGVMLGDGEVWISGVCRDDACKRSDVRVIAIQSTGDDGTPAFGPLATYRDWVLGCDNLNACTAIGMAAEDGVSGYVVIRRDAGPDAAPIVALNVLASDAPEDPVLAVSVAASAYPDTRFPVEPSGVFLVATPDPAASAALAAGQHLDLTEVDGGAAQAPQRVSLRGATAALLRMDDVQGRVGTTTVLIRPGSAAAVPPAPAAPRVTRVAMTALPDPLPPVPAGLAVRDDEGCGDGFDPIAFRLSDTQTLWGLCAEAGAYNVAYRYWIVGPDGAAPADFALPGDGPEDDPALLTNAGLSPDGLVLNAFAKGRGLGDCGVTTDWAWTGAAFAPLRHRELDTCRGVDPADWPRLYAAD
jgi:hypothetical protein